MGSFTSIDIFSVKLASGVSSEAAQMIKDVGKNYL